ncbi:MAG TPA: chemotaxis response regulator protein-glutamate methylesterase, partial [Xanthobacteraceae bacterium]|nr:chemotaxis response regulator protein-glutamate methylesterase [Xanthobacteraceae bacterium]
DDAVVVRGLVSRWLEEEGFQVVASLRTGRDAVNQIERANPDIVLLDVEMPELDGISALPLLLEKKRDLVVIMVSTVTRRNAEISLRALALGAADYVPKPETNRGVTTSLEFRRELIEKVRHLGNRRRAPAARAPVRPVGTAAERHAAPIKLRPFSPVVPRALLIGASTGGPQALNTIASRIGRLVDTVPVLITQHMPPMFTTILAEHLARSAERPAHEAGDGEPIHPGTIYLAPGGRHMRLAQHNGAAVIALDDGPLVNFCRPAVDPLFASAARVYGAGALAVILTGMGTDGALGAADIAAAGGSVIAQDEATSVVWGMPGSAAHAGICSAVLALDEIAPKLVRIFAGDRT